MKPLNLLSKALDIIVGLALFVLLLIPPLYLQMTLQDTFKIPQEVLIVTFGWVFIGLVGLQRAFAGLPIWAGGRGSWTRWAVLTLATWILVTGMIGYAPAEPWRFGMTAITYMLVGQSMLDWMARRIERRRIVVAGLLGLATLEVGVALIELARLPLSVWANQVPLFTTPTGMAPGGWWPHDVLYVLSFPAINGTPIGTLGNVNYLAEFLALTLPALLGWGLSSKHRIAQALSILAALPVVYVLLATGTRAAMLGLMFGGALAVGLVWGWQVLNLKEHWATPRGKASIIGAGAFIGIMLTFAGSRIFEKLSHTASDAAISSRFYTWKSALGLWSEHLMLGTGLGGFRILNVGQLAKAFPNGLPQELVDVRFGQVHNEPLQILVELGLIGGLAVLACVIAWYRDVYRNPSLSDGCKVGLLWGIGALLIASCFGFPFHIAVTSIAVVAVLALGLSRPSDQDAEPVVPVVWRPAYALVLAGLVAVVGAQVYSKDVWPLFLAHKYELAGKRLQDADRHAEAQAVYELAMRQNRFKGGEAYAVLVSLNAQDKYDEVLKRYDDYVRLGLGGEGIYWKARALYGSGHTIEAVNVYNGIIKTFGDKSDNAKRAKRRLAEIAGDIVRHKEKSGVKLVIKKEIVPPTPDK